MCTYIYIYIYTYRDQDSAQKVGATSGAGLRTLGDGPLWRGQLWSDVNTVLPYHREFYSLKIALKIQKCSTSTCWGHFRTFIFFAIRLAHVSFCSTLTNGSRFNSVLVLLFLLPLLFPLAVFVIFGYMASVGPKITVIGLHLTLMLG